MSYNGIPAFIIIVTPLVAFYLLYRAKELNLGILISISLGAVILEVTFLPVFKTVMILLKESIFVNKSLAFIISVLIVLVIFLFLILIISLIVSLIIPNKVIAIDCCAVIDRTIAKIKFGNVENILKKPVDTEQNIDTMGIEENQELIIDNTLHNVTSDDLSDCNESLEEANYVVEDSSQDLDCVDKTIEGIDSVCDNLVDLENEEIVTSDISDVKEEKVFDYLNKNVTEDLIAKTEEPKDDTVGVSVIETRYPEIGIVERKTQIPAIEEEQIERKTQIPAIEEELNASATMDLNDAKSLVLKALQNKSDNKKEEAIECYLKALQQQPDSETIFWIVIDVCALYKQLGLNELAKSILESLASRYGNVIKPEVKKEIMNCLH